MYKRQAQAEKKSLEEELAELQTDLSDYQADYAYDATVDALDKMTESYEEYTNNKIEAIEDEMSSYQKLYDEALVRIKTDGERDVYKRQFVDDVVKSCFIGDTGEYHPELKPFFIKSNVLEAFANFKLPPNASRRYDIIYNKMCIRDSCLPL